MTGESKDGVDGCKDLSQKPSAPVPVCIGTADNRP